MFALFLFLGTECGLRTAKNEKLWSQCITSLSLGIQCIFSMYNEQINPATGVKSVNLIIKIER